MSRGDSLAGPITYELRGYEDGSGRFELLDDKGLHKGNIVFKKWYSRESEIETPWGPAFIRFHRGVRVRCDILLNSNQLATVRQTSFMLPRFSFDLENGQQLNFSSKRGDVWYRSDSTFGDFAWRTGEVDSKSGLSKWTIVIGERSLISVESVLAPIAIFLAYSLQIMESI